MDKKTKIITYIIIGVLLLLLVGVAITTKFSNTAPGITVYAENGGTAEAILGGHTWKSFIKDITVDSQDTMQLTYDNKNTLLVKPSEKITLRNSGKNFDSYKFYQEYITYYDEQGNSKSIGKDEAPVNTESKLVTFNAPQEDGTYLFHVKLLYHRSGNAEYHFKVVVSSKPSYTVESIVKYKNTYIGDATKVSQVLNALPYKEYRDGIVLRTANKPYELIAYYKGLEVDKEAMLNNTVAIFALIDNVDIVTYELDSKSFVYTRKELETVLGRDLTEYANNTELWKKEVFYNVKDVAHTDNMNLYRTLLNEVLSKISSDYIVIDLDSFGKISLTDVEKRDLLKEFMKNGKIISEASNAEIRQRDSFKGILVYASEVTEIENGYAVSVVKYDTEKKQETLKYEVLKDGTIKS